MTAQKLVDIYNDLENLGVEVFLDGGWGVDALLGEQTREHKDADLVVFKHELEKIKQYFLTCGYEDQTEGNVWWHFFMRSKDNEIDFLVLEKADDGGAYYGPRENNAYFPPDAFGGRGLISGKPVLCLSPEYRVLCLTRAYGVVVRNNYQINEKDCRDLIAICRKFNIEIPTDYTEFMQTNGLEY
jgi:lincosamide nucleotidyltransferase A/C/D/E